MFTGIITEIGTVREVRGDVGDAAGTATLRIAAHEMLADATHGCSIAVNGVCLTVVEFGADWFTADVMGETLAVTALGDLGPGASVNLERALRADGRLDGHIVQGHVDAVGELVERRPAERWEVLRFTAPAAVRPHLVHKGSVAVQGTSLTVSGVTDDGFEVSLIPVTLAETTLGALAPGDRVNIETDVLAKYVLNASDTGRYPTGRAQKEDR